MPCFGMTMAEFFCLEEETMIPADEDMKKLFDDWQKLNSTQKDAIKAHIKRYLQ